MYTDTNHAKLDFTRLETISSTHGMPVMTNIWIVNKNL